MAGALLEARALTVVYRRGKQVVRALDDVTFDAVTGETTGLVGESGSGKSTIARSVLGLAPIASGSVSFAGEDITRLGAGERRHLYRRIQMVFQDPYSSLNPSRTIGHTLAEPLQAFGERDHALVQRQVGAMLDRVHLPSDTAECYPAELSGGQRQRVAIARALMPSPELLLLDEPLSALDLSVQAQILNLLQELQAAAGISFIFISHDLDVVRYLCDNVIVLYQGRIMETGPAARVATAPAHPYTSVLQQAAPVPNPRLQQQRRHAAAPPLPRLAQPPRQQDAPSQCAFAPRCAYAADLCWHHRPPLAPVDVGGKVACHRYPQWQSEAPAASWNTRHTPAAPSRTEADAARS